MVHTQKRTTAEPDMFEAQRYPSAFVLAAQKTGLIIPYLRIPP